MRVRLKGINLARARLASGEVVTYYYAWRGGPRLVGQPGSPEFVQSYHDAIAQRRENRRKVDTLTGLIDAYQDAAEFKGLAEATRRGYRQHLAAIEREFGDFPVTALADRRSRGEFLAWRDRLAVSSRRGADYRFAVFARVLSWAFNRGLAPLNPLERPGRLYRAARKEKVWTDEDEAAFLAKAPEHLHLALLLALWTGQRQGDLLRLTWAAYDGQTLRFSQSKTGARLLIPVGQPLKVALDAHRDDARSAVTILTTASGRPWTSDGFRASWGKACEKAGIVDLTFHDLRGTAVTRLALAGCTVAEIATITGHALRDVGAILDAHYLKRDQNLAVSAIAKLETRTKLQNEMQNGRSDRLMFRPMRDDKT
jgi:integrase